MRAFLREPSTPWIVFDREGRPPSQLAVGEVLSVPRKTLLSDYKYDFFPNTAAVDGAAASATPQSNIEPSSLALASDLAADGPHDAEPGAPDADAAPPMFGPMFGLSRRVLGASVALVAALSIFAVGAVALRSSSDGSSVHAAAAAQPAARATGAAMPSEIPPPDLDAKSPAVTAPAAAAPAAAATATPREEPAARGKAKQVYGRLSIAGDARGKDVFLDGKRLLGRGARNFTVMCGTHSIAVGTRTDGHDFDVPCGAELIVGK